MKSSLSSTTPQEIVPKEHAESLDVKIVSTFQENRRNMDLELLNKNISCKRGNILGDNGKALHEGRDGAATCAKNSKKHEEDLESGMP